MAESGRIEQMFEKLAEILTAKELVKLAQLFLAKTSELMSDTEESNGKEKMEQLQGSSRGSKFPKENKKVTMLSISSISLVLTKVYLMQIGYLIQVHLDMSWVHLVSLNRIVHIHPHIVRLFKQLMEYANLLKVLVQ
jgi:hypothetical protein